MSGRARATCCTSTASASAASPARAMPSPASVTARAPSGGCASATSSCTRSSTTTLAYSELHRDERAVTVVGFLERALAFFDGHGIETRRLLSDNAWAYTHSGALRQLLERRRIRHLLIEKRRPQTNGKVERYQQTLKREWALGQVYRSSEHRAAALSHWVEHYNTCRPHSALGGRPPISRVHNVARQDT